MGVTPDYAVGVWCGNADGHGVAGMTGAKTAGPVLFDLLNLLPPTTDWFEEPLDGGVWLDVCKESGMLRSQECPDYVRILLPAQAQESEVCPYHKDGTFRLPPAMEWYYKAYHPEYEVRPATRDAARMEFLYPEGGSILTLRQRGRRRLPGRPPRPGRHPLLAPGRHLPRRNPPHPPDAPLPRPRKTHRHRGGR